MKKLFLAAFAALLTSATFAQTAVPATTATPATPAPTAKKMEYKKGGKPAEAKMDAKSDMEHKGGEAKAQGQNKMADAATRAQKMTDKLTQSLGLDAATSAKVLAAATTRCQKVDELQKMTDNKAKDTALKANSVEYKAALKGILTPAQFAKMSEMGDKGKGDAKKGDSKAN